MAVLKQAIAAYVAYKQEAHAAFDLYAAHCELCPPPRVPGCDTVVRLAHRISCGRTIEEAAAREYLYRWYLAIKAPDQCNATGRHDWRSSDPRACVSIFGTPHTIGM